MEFLTKLLGFLWGFGSCCLTATTTANGGGGGGGGASASDTAPGPLSNPSGGGAVAAVHNTVQANSSRTVHSYAACLQLWHELAHSRVGRRFLGALWQQHGDARERTGGP